ncbi:hypothetical protein SEVIR_9G488850v4 [Setaria viridis]
MIHPAPQAVLAVRRRGPVATNLRLASSLQVGASAMDQMVIWITLLPRNNCNKYPLDLDKTVTLAYRSVPSVRPSAVTIRTCPPDCCSFAAVSDLGKDNAERERLETGDGRGCTCAVLLGICYILDMTKKFGLIICRPQSRCQTLVRSEQSEGGMLWGFHQGTCILKPNAYA